MPVPYIITCTQTQPKSKIFHLKLDYNLFFDHFGNIKRWVMTATIFLSTKSTPKLNLFDVQ